MLTMLVACSRHHKADITSVFTSEAQSMYVIDTRSFAASAGIAAPNDLNGLGLPAAVSDEIAALLRLKGADVDMAAAVTYDSKDMYSIVVFAVTDRKELEKSLVREDFKAQEIDDFKVFTAPWGENRKFYVVTDDFLWRVVADGPGRAATKVDDAIKAMDKPAPRWLCEMIEKGSSLAGALKQDNGYFVYQFSLDGPSAKAHVTKYDAEGSQQQWVDENTISTIPPEAAKALDSSATLAFAVGAGNYADILRNVNRMGNIGISTFEIETASRVLAGPFYGYVNLKGRLTDFLTAIDSRMSLKATSEQTAAEVVKSVANLIRYSGLPVSYSGSVALVDIDNREWLKVSTEGDVVNLTVGEPKDFKPLNPDDLSNSIMWASYNVPAALTGQFTAVNYGAVGTINMTYTDLDVDFRLTGTDKPLISAILDILK